MEQRQIMDISFKSILKIILLFLVFLLAWKIWDIIAGIFLAIVLASIVEGAIEFLKKIKFPRVLSAVLIYLAIFAAFYSAFYFLIPPFVKEVKELALSFPNYLEKFSPQLEGAKSFLIEYKTSENFQKALIALGDKLAKITSSIPAFLSTVFGGMVTAFLIIFVSFLLSLEEKGVEKFLGFFTPLNHRQDFVRLLAVSQKKMRDWFKGRLFSALIIGLFVYLGLLLIGAKYKLTLALVAALFEFIPIIGPWFAGIIGVIVVGFQSLKLGLFTIILYIVVQFVDNHFITPLVMRKTVGINPILTLLVLLIGARLGGILGILIAVPLTAIIIEVVNDFRKKKGLEPLPK